LDTTERGSRLSSMRNLKIDSQHSFGKRKSVIVSVGETIGCEDLRAFLFCFIVVRLELSAVECN